MIDEDVHDEAIKEDAFDKDSSHQNLIPNFVVRMEIYDLFNKFKKVIN